MFRAIAVTVFAAALIVPSGAFFTSRACSRTSVSVSSAVAEAPAVTQLQSPDFYWQFRLDRLVNQFKAMLPYSSKNYPDSTNSRALYDAYYLDLTLQGKLEGFDFVGEKDINDSEWMTIYRQISEWTKTVNKENKLDVTNIPKNEFDLLKRFYPNLNYRDLEISFSEDEVGKGFPYKNMKEMLGAAAEGKLNIPGYSKDITAIEASSIRAELADFKSKTMKKIDDVYANALTYAKNAFPDDTAKEHYKQLRVQLATFPQSPAAWAKYRADFEKEVDEMARLAGKKEEEHHHHEGEHDDSHMSSAQEFELKYGRNLDEMQERMNQFKSDPTGFLESSIIAKFGKQGLDVWKKSQEFSAKMDTLTAAEKASTEQEFSSFLNKA